jgi:trimethylamine--corrinoid protein Co-methyltransferase
VKPCFDISNEQRQVPRREKRISFQETIHNATLEILQNTGIKVMNEDAVELFHSFGGIVERYNGQSIVKIPPHMVETCLACVPRNVTYSGRVSDENFLEQQGSVSFTTFGGCIKIIDPITRQRRLSRKTDLENIIRVCDYIDEIRVVIRALNATDVSSETQSVHNMDSILKNTGKHFIIGADSPASLRTMIALAAVSVDGIDKLLKAPIFSVSVCPVSPLVIPQNTAGVIIEAANAGIGIVVIPMALSGGTSAATLAGTLVSHNAEVLSCIILAQLARKGTNCTYGSCSTILDLRYGTSAVGSPECAKLNSAISKLSKYYKLPSFVGAGCSDSKVPDQQSAYEFSLNASIAALAGANIIAGCGGLEQGLTMDYAKLIMDAEMIRMISNSTADIPFDDDALALDIIQSVGPGGTFLTHEHTLRHMRDQSYTRLFDRRTFEDWGLETVNTSLIEHAYVEAIDIINSHQSPKLPSGAEIAMKRIIREFESKAGFAKGVNTAVEESAYPTTGDKIVGVC